MSEGVPSERKEEPVPAPEWWSNPALRPYSHEFLKFHFTVAEVAARKLGIPLKEAIERFTNYGEMWDDYTQQHSPSGEGFTEHLADSEAKWCEKFPSIPYHDVENHRFGCFHYKYDADIGTVQIHFNNYEFHDAGPLSAETRTHRMQELHDLFSEVKRLHPDAKYVQGNSWLYNIPAYRSLFPLSYIANLVPDIDTSDIHRGVRAWGQFVDKGRGLKQDVANLFLDRLEAMDVKNAGDIWLSLPYKPLKTRGPVEDFYSLYNVA